MDGKLGYPLTWSTLGNGIDVTLEPDNGMKALHNRFEPIHCGKLNIKGNAQST